jgi:pimeloyl-ACP methyl ester carboxylesterase
MAAPSAAQAARRVGQERSVLHPPGAEAYRKDVPDANIVLLVTGHFAPEEEADTIAELTDKLMRSAFDFFGG